MEISEQVLWAIFFGLQACLILDHVGAVIAETSAWREFLIKNSKWGH